MCALNTIGIDRHNREPHMHEDGRKFELLVKRFTLETARGVTKAAVFSRKKRTPFAILSGHRMANKFSKILSEPDPQVAIPSRVTTA